MKKKILKIMSCAMSAIIALSAMTITAGANESDIFEESTVKESTTGSFENPISWLPEEEISSENSTTDTEIYKIVVPFESKVYFSYSDYYTKGDTSLINVSIYDPNGKKFGVNNLKSLVTMMFTFSKGTYIFEITSNDEHYADLSYYMVPTGLEGSEKITTSNGWHTEYYTPVASTGGGNVTITWRPVDGATSYRVYRWKDGKYTRLAIRTSTYFIDTSAEIGETYKYYVSAYDVNTGIESSKSTANEGFDVTVTSTFDKTPEIISANVLSTSATLKWDVVPGATTYRIYRRNDNGTRKLIKAQSMTEFKDTGLTKGKIYKYEIRAYSSTTKSLTPYSKIKSVRPMAAPTILTGNVKGKITWDKNAVATSYRVYRAESLTGARTLLKAVNSTTYTDTTAESGKLYYYFVRAYDNTTGTLSAYSNMKAIKIA